MKRPVLFLKFPIFNTIFTMYVTLPLRNCKNKTGRFEDLAKKYRFTIKYACMGEDAPINGTSTFS